MKKIISFILLLLIFLVPPFSVQASLVPPFSVPTSISLGFEGIGEWATVDSYYSGGTDSEGNPGPNYGITFSTESLSATVIKSVDSKIMTWLDSNQTVLNSENPFNILSFDYKTNFDVMGEENRGSLEVYSGPYGLGDLIYSGEITGSRDWLNYRTSAFINAGQSIVFKNFNVPGAILIDNINIVSQPVTESGKYGSFIGTDYYWKDLEPLWTEPDFKGIESGELIKIASLKMSGFYEDGIETILSSLSPGDEYIWSGWNPIDGSWALDDDKPYDYLSILGDEVMITADSWNPLIVKSDDFQDVIIPSQSVPEPTAMLLLGSGLVGFVGFRRKFRKK